MVCAGSPERVTRLGRDLAWPSPSPRRRAGDELAEVTVLDGPDAYDFTAAFMAWAARPGDRGHGRALAGARLRRPGRAGPGARRQVCHDGPKAYRSTKSSSGSTSPRVIVGFGGTFAYGIIISTAMKSHPQERPGDHGRHHNQNSRVLVTGGGLIVLITGVYLLNDAWDTSDFFGAFGFVAVIVLLGLGHGYFRPNEIKALQAAERDIAAAGDGDIKWSPEFEQANGRLAKMGSVAGIIVVVTVYVMIDKPFL